MDLNLSGKHALVCGGNRGIGLASAQLLAQLGANVTLVARDKTRLQQALSQLDTKGGNSHATVCADFDQLDRAIERILKRLTAAPAEILINNAGGPPGGPITAASEADFVVAFKRHLVTSHSLVQLTLPAMRAAGYGRIINIVSTSVREPIAGLGVSNTIRGAVASWAKTLAAELGPEQITVNNVLPGYTETERLQSLIQNRAGASGDTAAVAAQLRAQVPLGRFAQAHEIGNLVAFLASPAAAYISGQSIAVDGCRTRCI